MGCWTPSVAVRGVDRGAGAMFDEVSIRGVRVKFESMQFEGTDPMGYLLDVISLVVDHTPFDDVDVMNDTIM
jgi:hypothetical protein